MKTWYEKCGFEANPFEIDPLKTEVERTLFEREKESKEVIYRIASQNMLFIEGAKGIGKTALLKHAIDNFKGKGKVIYVDSNQVNKKLNIEQLLSGAKKYNPTNDKYPKDMILLLDNVDELSKVNNERIKYLFDQNYLKSVVFTGRSYEEADFTESVRSRIGNRVIRLQSISEDASVDLVRERLGDKNKGIISDEMIKNIYSRAEGDLKKFMMYMQIVLEETNESKKKKATKQIIESVLSQDVESSKDFAEGIESERKQIEETKICEECSGELKKYGEYYRCEHCDTFCTECGSMIQPDDNECPECGVKFETVEAE